MAAITEAELVGLGFTIDESTGYYKFICQDKDFSFAKKRIAIFYAEEKFFVEVVTEYFDRYGVKESGDLQTITLSVEGIGDVISAIKLFYRSR
jgi:hypothetical protein